MWEQVKMCKLAGIKSIYQTMFDEINEGTAIYKVNNDPPVGGRFLTYEGLPNDFYLKMVGDAGKYIRGELIHRK